MATLDRIIELQKQGMSESQISTQLRNEGINPREINDSLNQAKIKNAVSPPEQITSRQGTPNSQNAPQGMQQSIMQGSEQSISEERTPQIPSSPQTPLPEIYPPQGQPQQYYEQPQYYEQSPQEEYYPPAPQAYSQQDYYTPSSGTDPETISEIAEQVATEKLNEYKRKTGDIISFKNKIQDQVNNIDDRLKRIESSIDKLQQAIIGKIGEFGESNAAIHQDLETLHGTVSKLMNPLIDNINEMKKINR